MIESLATLSDLGIGPALIVVVFLAAMMQAVTGIGFGVVAGPMLLVVMGTATAIQVSIVLSFLIALLMAPGTVPRVERRMLWPLLIGVCLGTPIGVMAILSLSIGALKTVAAVVVAFMTLVASGVLARYPLFRRDTVGRRIAAGVVSGVLNTALAMPGPAIAAYATAIKSDPGTIRATTLVTFLFAYPVALAFQSAFVGVSGAVMSVAVPLAVPTCLGALSGMLIARHVNETVFRWLTLFFLTASILALVLG